MGQLIGPLIELVVAQLLTAKTQGNGLRCFQHLSFKALMRALLGRISLQTGIPALQGRLTLIGAQQRQVSNALPHIVRHGLQQVAPVARHALDGGRIEQVGGVDQ